MRTPILPTQGTPLGRAVVPNVPKAQAIPFAQWPEAFQYYARKRSRPGDLGLGDVLERSFGKFGRLFRAWYERITGHPCHCQERKEWLNARYPLPSQETRGKISS